MSKRKKKQHNKQNTDNQTLDSQEVVVVEAKPIPTEEEKNQTAAPQKVENIKIDKIGDLTFNLFANPIKKRYEKHYKEKQIHILTDLALIAIVLILIGAIVSLYYFSKARLNNLVDFQVSSAPVELVNGQEAEFIINYNNTTNDTLTDAVLVLKIPNTLHNAEFSTQDYDLKTNSFKIGDLAPKAHGEFSVKGFLLGDLETKQEFLAIINYNNKYGQDRQEFFEQGFELNGSAFTANLTLPGKVIATGPFETKLNMKNTSEIDFDQIRIKMNWPNNYVYSHSEFKQEPVNNTWTIGKFNSQQEANYIFTGRAYADSPQTQYFNTQILATYDGSEYFLAKAENSVFVDFSKIKVNFTNLETTHSINPGGQSTYTIEYTNNENHAVTNVELGLIVKGEYAADNQVRYNKNDYPELARIEPGQTASIEVPANAKTIIDFTGEKKESYSLEVRSFISYDDPVENARISVESKPITTAVSSRLSISSTGVFFTPQGDQIGVGSVPPVVGEYTSYWVFIKLINTNNNIKDLKVTAQVPGNVEFTDIYNVTEGSQIIFNSDSRTIEWRVGDLSAFSGIFNAAPEARIQLAITPTEGQAGTSPALLTNIKATASDNVTGSFLTASGKNISTAIFGEDFLNKVIE